MDHKNNVTKTQLLVALILTLLVSITGSTYAYFAATSSNSNTITGDAATVNLTLEVSKIYPKANSDNTGVLVPQLSTTNSATSPLANALKSGCVDANKNVVCHVYKVNIKNQGGSATQVVNGNISFFGNPALTTDIATVMPSLKWRLVSSVNETTASNSVLGANVDHTATSGGDKFVSDLTMPNNSNFNYYLIVWINETNTDQVVDEGNSFYGMIDFDASNGSGVTAVFGDTTSAIDDTQYTVTFNPNGGTVSTASKQVTVGQKYGALPTPTRSGYTFKGWNGKNLLNTYDIDNTSINGLMFNVSNNVFNVFGVNTFSSDNYIAIRHTDNLPNLIIGKEYTLSVTDNVSGIYKQLNYKNSSGTAYAFVRLPSNSNQDYTSSTFVVPNNYSKTDCFFIGVWNTATSVEGSFRVQLEEGNTATPYEPYFITTNTKVVQAKNHTLTAIWEAN